MERQVPTTVSETPHTTQPPVRSHAESPPKAFAGHDASRALGLLSTKPEDVRPDWYDLDDVEKDTLNKWFTYFSKRYNVVGTVEGATNKDPAEGS
ncbi:hypothetical protein IMZ48_16470 [Candidatus Bathyarchaeota archaeon]|nr:hypothetical protein [Candidatus Bathyarchaeota archaeon]